jgi:SRSO17 transposase
MEETGLRAELDDFAGTVFASLGRKDQRAKGRLYLQGLMLEGRRKSMQPMAERLGMDHQQLQQFVTSSPWEVEPVRRRLAALAEEAIAPEAWVIDDTGFKKDGTASACVARQYSGTLGKIGNCQIAAPVRAPGLGRHLRRHQRGCRGSPGPAGEGGHTGDGAAPAKVGARAGND